MNTTSSFQNYEFALFIKDESSPEEELHNRTELYQGITWISVTINRWNMHSVYSNETKKE